jgi:hypothetical protein
MKHIEIHMHYIWDLVHNGINFTLREILVKPTKLVECLSAYDNDIPTKLVECLSAYDNDIILINDIIFVAEFL